MNKLKEMYLFVKDYLILRSQRGDNSDFPFGKMYPILGERYSESGTMSGHYFHQDLLVARRIFENNPNRHVDIGSRTDGFVAHVASYREIELFDIRPQKINIKNITFRQANLMNLPKDMISYTDSISSLHAIEHFGLGRYGDPVDYNGHIKAIDNIYKILKKGGKFYFSAPIGSQRIEFNAHRVFSITYLLALFKDRFTITNFSYVSDSGELHENVNIDSKEAINNFNCLYGCGIFEMNKK